MKFTTASLITLTCAMGIGGPRGINEECKLTWWTKDVNRCSKGLGCWNPPGVNFLRIGRCKAKLGSQCSIDDDCFKYPNAACHESKCTLTKKIPGYQKTATTGQIPKVTNLSEPRNVLSPENEIPDITNLSEPRDVLLTENSTEIFPAVEDKQIEVSESAKPNANSDNLVPLMEQTTTADQVEPVTPEQIASSLPGEAVTLSEPIVQEIPSVQEDVASTEPTLIQEPLVGFIPT